MGTSLVFKTGVILCLLGSLSFSSESPFGGGKQSLYSPEDEVYSLTVNTIYDEIFSSERAWLVEFYSSWCGHCVSFAPKWKQFAEDLKSWKSVVVIAAIDCADEINIPACRAFDILGYPTLKLFGPNTPRLVKDLEVNNTTLNTGEVFKRPNSMSQLKSNLIEELVPMFPKLLTPISNRTLFSQESDIWKDPEFKDGPSFILVLFERNRSHVGMEVALRLSNYRKEIRVIRFPQKNRFYENLGLDGWPAVGYITRDSGSGQILLGNNQDLINLVVKSALGLVKTDFNKSGAEVEKSPQDHAASASSGNVESDLGETNLQEIPADTIDKVSMEDLLHTVRNALRNEVPLHRILDGPRLIALRDFVTILSQYFPADRRDVRLFLVKLSDWIRPQRQFELSTYLDKLAELETEYNPWDFDLNSWEDCRGTITGRRGYTCGLWRLFHTLTIVALDKHADSDVLPAIIGYVKYFFGCQECVTHFESMVERDKIMDNHSITDQTRWLWRTHNEVNLRLRGTPSEDPSHPKGLYPSGDLCPLCYSNPQLFDETEVEKYLLKVYTRPERFAAAPSRLSLAEGEGLKGKNSSFGGFFSLTDIGIFMIVYLSIALLLVLGYLHFRGVSKRRRIADPTICLRRLCSPRNSV